MDIDRRVFLEGGSSAAATARPGKLSPALIGGWTLVDAVTSNPSGEKTPWTPSATNPGGMMTFTSSGLISLQVAALPAYVPTPAPTKGFADRWFGYFGRYRVDELRGELLVELLSSYVLSEMTSSRPKQLQLSGGLLTLTKPPPPTGEPRYNTLRWRRL